MYLVLNYEKIKENECFRTYAVCSLTMEQTEKN
jgi:hypothetical protein